MHNFEEQIERWREELMVSRGIEAEVVDELEDHLRQKLDDLSDVDLSSGDAFTLAKIRLGHPGSLCHEFEKLHGHSVRLKQVGYMIGGYLVIDVMLKAVKFASTFAAGLSLFATDTVELLGWAYMATGVLLFILLGLGLLRLAQADSSLMSINIFRKSSSAFRRYPIYAVLTALLTYLVVTLINKVGLNLVLARFLSAGKMGEFHWNTLIYEICVTLVVPLALTAILAWVVRIHGRVNRQIPQ